MKFNQILIVLLITFLGFNQTHAQTAAANLKLWWKLNETAGVKSITDYAPNGKQIGEAAKNATINCGKVDPQKGNVAAFEKMGNVITLKNPTLNQVVGGANRTYSIWAKKEVTQGPIDQIALIGQLSVPGGGGGLLIITPANGKAVTLLCGQDSKVHFINPSSTASNEGVWHHYVITSTDGTTAGLRCYVDNVEWKANAISPVPLQTTNVIRIGHSFTGNISDFRVYDKALSKGEIEAVFKEISITK